MPELPEVEVLVRHLAPLLHRKTIHSVTVHRSRVLRPTSPRELERVLKGARLAGLVRRGKYLLFEIQPRAGTKSVPVVGHLGMTGRMYLLPRRAPLPKHAAVVLGLGPEQFVFEDTRYFGRFTLDSTPLKGLGPEPLSSEFTAQGLAKGLGRSKQAIKVKLLDQSLVAGIGNIYASEALFKAGISPKTAARKIKGPLAARLWRAIQRTLRQAIEFGSTVPLDYAGSEQKDGLFYYGSSSNGSAGPEERLLVYDRKGLPCFKCGSKIKRIVQAARSTFYCPQCQRSSSW